VHHFTFTVPVSAEVATPPGVGYSCCVSDYEKAVVTRLKTARGHLDGVIRMVEHEAYCPDVMKQLAAVQGLVEATSRMVFRNHLETCVAKAMQEGRTAEIVDELMETLKYDKRVLRPTLTDVDTPPPTISPDRSVP
jgi:CsoR family transcriptional regulator, copper-sensing transcriptional repressor